MKSSVGKELEAVRNQKLDELRNISENWSLFKKASKLIWKKKNCPQNYLETCKTSDNIPSK